METEKLEKQNRRDLRKELYRFIGYFVVLVALSFVMIYFFYETYTEQSDSIRNDIIAYKTILNKQQILKAKIDTIYYQMSLLNTGKVENDVFLENYISQNVQDTRSMIGSDSASEFKQYAYLLSNIDSLMLLKDNITTISNQEQLALKDLTECIGKTSQIQKTLAQDPTRGY
jgi:hypothetical protein